MKIKPLHLKRNHRLILNCFAYGLLAFAIYLSLFYKDSSDKPAIKKVNINASATR